MSTGVKRKKIQVTKALPQPKRTIENAEDDHEVGLWINQEFFRRHQSRPTLVLTSNSNPTGNRYLELADVALGIKKSA